LGHRTPQSGSLVKLSSLEARIAVALRVIELRHEHLMTSFRSFDVIFVTTDAGRKPLGLSAASAATERRRVT
jgi:hypothetical protein